jgi:hypothetical protein
MTVACQASRPAEDALDRCTTQARPERFAPDTRRCEPWCGWCGWCGLGAKAAESEGNLVSRRPAPCLVRDGAVMVRDGEVMVQEAASTLRSRAGAHARETPRGKSAPNEGCQGCQGCHREEKPGVMGTYGVRPATLHGCRRLPDGCRRLPEGCRRLPGFHRVEIDLMSHRPLQFAATRRRSQGRSVGIASFPSNVRAPADSRGSERKKT